MFIAGLFVVGKYHDQKKNGFDWLSFIVLAGAFTCLILVLNQISHGLKNIYLWVFLILSITLLYIFIKLSKNSTKKLLNLAVFKQRAFVYGAIAYFLLQFINIGTSFVLPNYVQIVGHQTSLVGGLILLPGSIIAGVLNPLFGNIYDHVGAKLPLFLGGTTLAISCVLFWLFGLHLTSLLIVIVYGFLMLGHRMAFSNTMAESLNCQPQSLRVDATAVCQTSQQLAGSVGTTIMASIIAVWQSKGGASYAQLTAQGSQAAFGFTSLLSIIILISYWRMFKLENKKNN
ncbi:hypothetical protein GCM10022297_03470 [Lactobacillus hamsteri]|uniref:Multi-drug-type permease n=1 Tax=Lactobacillus hamsteri DSM 5661 = JCM 6256 TaxID=1423754 RepID=A0A0R1Y9C3_9LACO|nr:MFS transporter [Lactobacillus hamsteri]KRM37268.1 multi-drug-type permease [Lactobacillus hamsteri DSM 5661 = JCM 6256]